MQARLFNLPKKAQPYSVIQKNELPLKTNHAGLPGPANRGIWSPKIPRECVFLHVTSFHLSSRTRSDFHYFVFSGFAHGKYGVLEPSALHSQEVPSGIRGANHRSRVHTPRRNRKCSSHPFLSRILMIACRFRLLAAGHKLPRHLMDEFSLLARTLSHQSWLGKFER